MRRFQENGHKRTRTLLIKDLTSVSNARHKSSFFIVCFFVCVSERNVQNLFVVNVLTQIFTKAFFTFIYHTVSRNVLLPYFPMWMWDCSFPFHLS